MMSRVSSPVVAVQSLDERTNGGDAVGSDVRGVVDGPPDVPERFVDRRREGVDHRGLPFSREHDAGTAVVAQVADHRLEDLGVDLVELHRSRELVDRADVHVESLGEHGGDRRDVAGADDHPVVRVHARDREHALDRVDAAQLLLLRVGRLEPPLGGPVAREPVGGGVGHQGIGVEADHDVRAIESRMDAVGRTERGAGADAGAVAVDRLVLVPGGLRVLRRELLSHAGHAGTAGGLGEDRHRTGAERVPSEGPGLLGHPRLELVRGRGLSVPQDVAASVRVVDAEHLALRHGVAGAHRRRVVGVALELHRPGVVAPYEDALAHAAPLEAGRVVDRLARDPLLRPRGVGHDVLLGNAAAGRGPEAREGEGGPHDLDELSSIVALQEVGVRRELAMHPGAEVLAVLEVVETAPVGAASPGRASAGVARGIAAPRVVGTVVA